MAVVSLVEIKLTALLSSHPTATMLCCLLTAILDVPRGKLWPFDRVNKVDFGTNLWLDLIVPLQYTFLLRR
jgi:hypothetical protein